VCRKLTGKNKVAVVSVDTHKQQLTLVLSKNLLKLLRRFQADAVKVSPPPGPSIEQSSPPNRQCAHVPGAVWVAVRPGSSGVGCS